MLEPVSKPAGNEQKKVVEESAPLSYKQALRRTIDDGRFDILLFAGVFLFMFSIFQSMSDPLASRLGVAALAGCVGGLVLTAIFLIVNPIRLLERKNQLDLYDAALPLTLATFLQALMNLSLPFLVSVIHNPSLQSPAIEGVVAAFTAVVSVMFVVFICLVIVWYMFSVANIDEEEDEARVAELLAMVEEESK